MPVFLQSGPNRPRVKSELNDVSSTGLSVRVRLQDEELFVRSARLLVALRLPGQSKLIAFCGHIRHRILADDAIRYGIEFDAEETKDFERQQDRVARYVLALQIESIRNDRAQRLGA